MAVLIKQGRSFRSSHNFRFTQAGSNRTSSPELSCRVTAQTDALAGDRIEITLAEVPTPIPA